MQKLRNIGTLFGRIFLPKEVITTDEILDQVAENASSKWEASILSRKARKVGNPVSARN